MLTTKILLNSIISTHGAHFMTIDIKDFYLNTPMDRPEFMRLKMADIPKDFIELYNLRQLATPDGLCTGSKRYVWSSAGRHHCTTTP
jgi:hypothetical protein